MNSSNDWHPITAFVAKIVGDICREPDRLIIEENASERGLIIQVTSALNDHCILVGKDGLCFNSLRRFVARAGLTHQIIADMPPLIKDDKGEPNTFNKFSLDPNFDVMAALALLHKAADLIDLKIDGFTRQISPEGKLRITIPAHNAEDRCAIKDLNNFFFSWGYKMGRKIDIRVAE